MGSKGRAVAGCEHAVVCAPDQGPEFLGNTDRGTEEEQGKSREELEAPEAGVPQGGLATIWGPNVC